MYLKRWLCRHMFSIDFQDKVRCRHSASMLGLRQRKRQWLDQDVGLINFAVLVNELFIAHDSTKSTDDVHTLQE